MRSISEETALWSNTKFNEIICDRLAQPRPGNVDHYSLIALVIADLTYKACSIDQAIAAADNCKTMCDRYPSKTDRHNKMRLAISDQGTLSRVLGVLHRVLVNEQEEEGFYLQHKPNLYYKESMNTHLVQAPFVSATQRDRNKHNG